MKQTNKAKGKKKFFFSLMRQVNYFFFFLGKYKVLLLQKYFLLPNLQEPRPPPATQQARFQGPGASRLVLGVA